MNAKMGCLAFGCFGSVYGVILASKYWQPQRDSTGGEVVPEPVEIP